VTDPEAARLLEDEGSEWAKLESVFAGIPGDRFEEAGVTPEGWSPKDVMYHVARWAAEAADVLERIAAGLPVPEEHQDVETKNRAWFNESRDMDPDEVRRVLAFDRARMRAALEGISNVSTDAREWFEESGAIHYRSHLGDLTGWMGSGS
jgi:hypothetical protein